MKIKYLRSSGEIVSMGACEFQPDAQHDVLEAECGIPDRMNDYKIDAGAMREKTDSEKLSDKQAAQAAKQARRQRKKSIMQKLGMSKQDFISLLELLDDRSDD